MEVFEEAPVVEVQVELFRHGQKTGMFVDPNEAWSFHCSGAAVDEKEYAQKLREWLPTAEDTKLLKDIIANEPRWIAPKEGAKDPLASISEPRKSAINVSAN